MTKPSALLVSMPWTNLTEPSLGLGILKAILRRENIPCRILHLNIFLLKYLKYSTYQSLSYSYALCDFLFTAPMDPVVTDKQLNLLREMVELLIRAKILSAEKYGGYESLIHSILQLRNEIIPKWLQESAEEVVKGTESFIGFTCMFDQTMSSVALAKLIKEKAPEKLIALGGYSIKNPTAEMILKTYPWIDAVCTGEGESTISELAQASAGNISLRDVKGIVYRDCSGRVVNTPSSVQANLDANPIPDYDDFFYDVAVLASKNQIKIRPPVLPIENSRGCWWGEKNHCVFCGIKDADLVYRAKASKKVLDSMDELKNKYGIKTFRFSDYILPVNYYKTLIPELIQRQSPFNISCEMKSNITEEKFQQLSKAGFFEVQPGIESFNSAVLKKMKKGVSGVQNIFTLLLGKKYNVKILYNILFGFPSDQEAEYRDMLKNIPRFFHLDPPVTYIEVKITRWAPLHTDPESFGIRQAHAHHFYHMLFSDNYLETSGFQLDDFCYYFERTFFNDPCLVNLYNDIAVLIHHWKTDTTEKWLYRQHDDGHCIVRDNRSGTEKEYTISKEAEALLNQCTQPAAIEQVCTNCQPAMNKSTFDTAFEELDALGLIFTQDNQMISLVLADKNVFYAAPNIHVPIG